MDDKLRVPANPLLPRFIGATFFGGAGLACVLFSHWIAGPFLLALAAIPLVTRATCWELDRGTKKIRQMRVGAFSAPVQRRFTVSYGFAEVTEVQVLERLVTQQDQSSTQTGVMLVLRRGEPVVISPAPGDGERVAAFLGVPLHDINKEEQARFAEAIGQLPGQLLDAARMAARKPPKSTWQPSPRVIASVEAEIAQMPDSASAHERLASVLIAGETRQPAKAIGALERAQALYQAQAKAADAPRGGISASDRRRGLRRRIEDLGLVLPARYCSTAQRYLSEPWRRGSCWR
jgi:hypothetical protein